MLDLVRKIPNPYKSSLEGYFREEHEQFRQKLRQFLEENVTKKCEQWEKEKKSPIKEIVKLLGESNFLGARFSTNLGGKGLDVWYHVVVAEELARVPSGGIGMGGNPGKFSTGGGSTVSTGFVPSGSCKSLGGTTKGT